MGQLDGSIREGTQLEYSESGRRLASGKPWCGTLDCETTSINLYSHLLRAKSSRRLSLSIVLRSVCSFPRWNFTNAKLSSPFVIFVDHMKKGFLNDISKVYQARLSETALPYHIPLLRSILPLKSSSVKFYFMKSLVFSPFLLFDRSVDDALYVSQIGCMICFHLLVYIFR